MPSCLLLQATFLLTFGILVVSLTENTRDLGISMASELNDVIFDTLDLAEFSVPSLSRCLLSCSQDARCVSVFYQESRGQCRLQGGRFYLAQGGREEQGWRYYLLETDSQCPVKSGYIHRRDLSLCYRPEFQAGATQPEAVSNCTQEGGHLLRIDSQEKQDHMAQQLDSSKVTGVDFPSPANGSPGYFVDGEYINGSWSWPSTGQAMTFSNWYGNEYIVTNTPSQLFVIMGANQMWQWISVVNYHSRAYICEIRL